MGRDCEQWGQTTARVDSTAAQRPTAPQLGQRNVNSIGLPGLASWVRLGFSIGEYRIRKDGPGIRGLGPQASRLQEIRMQARRLRSQRPNSISGPRFLGATL